MRNLTRLCLTLAYLALASPMLSSCAPFHTSPDDICNDPTKNYTQDYAYECLHE